MNDHSHSYPTFVGTVTRGELTYQGYGLDRKPKAFRITAKEDASDQYDEKGLTATIDLPTSSPPPAIGSQLTVFINARNVMGVPLSNVLPMPKGDDEAQDEAIEVEVVESSDLDLSDFDGEEE